MEKNYHETYYEHSEAFLKQLPKGVFITVKDKSGRANTMTIAWGHIGVIWGKPCFVAYVRYSRFTYDLLINAEDYTINVPEYDTLKKALMIAGTQSGRDIDKFKEAGLTLAPSKKVTSPVIEECALQYECKIIYQQSQEPALIDPAIKEAHYKNHDTHIMFFGEILDSYTTNKKGHHS
jgi:flavin reductase (DIM6/NTAB) family NADH-FMN oxidoreductase RutF